MTYPPSEHVGLAIAPDGEMYTLNFYGENEGAAVITGPRPKPGEGLVNVPEVHREPATDVADARAKLLRVVRERGWRT